MYLRVCGERKSVVALYILADVQLNITIAQCYHCSSYSCIFLSIVYPTNVATEEADMYLFLGQHFILKNHKSSLPYTETKSSEKAVIVLIYVCAKFHQNILIRS